MTYCLKLRFYEGSWPKEIFSLDDLMTSFTIIHEVQLTQYKSPKCCDNVAFPFSLKFRQTDKDTTECSQSFVRRYSTDLGTTNRTQIEYRYY